MSDCCSSSCSTEKPRRLACPSNGREYVAVDAKTIIHHLKNPWNIDLGDQAYFFCNDPDCEVVYFGEDGKQFVQDDLRTVVGLKSKQDDKTICYCFGVTLDDYKKSESIRSYVTQQTKDSICACDIRNPSGRCCLKDFPKH